MSIVQLPFEPSDPNYRVGTTLDGVQYILDVRWFARDAAWYFNLLTADLTPLAHGIKIVLGCLLANRARVNPLFPPGIFYASDLSGAGVDAGLDDIQTRVAVYYESV